jgi:chemotaxis protein MotA
MKPRRRFDSTVVVGLLIAGVGILGGLLLEKGELRDVGQITAALIVFGGTLGAVIISTPRPALISALKRSRSVFWSSREEPSALIENLLRLGMAGRRSGFASIEPEAIDLPESFFKKAMMLLVDGLKANEIRSVLELDLIVSEQEVENDARVFEAAGGYAPTIGIIGAVLGLIQVMKHLESIQDVGRGIAVAFVATVYGVGFANLVLLPIGSKIRAQARSAAKLQEMIIEGVIGVQEGKNPRVIRQMLAPFWEKPAVKSEAGEPKPHIAYSQARKVS